MRARTVAGLPAGTRTPDYISLGVLARVFSADKVRSALEATQRAAADRFLPDVHTYLRLSPELRAQVHGPNAGDEPKVTGSGIRCCVWIPERLFP